MLRHILNILVIFCVLLFIRETVRKIETLNHKVYELESVYIDNQVLKNQVKKLKNQIEINENLDPTNTQWLNAHKELVKSELCVK